MFTSKLRTLLAVAVLSASFFTFATQSLQDAWSAQDQKCDSSGRAATCGTNMIESITGSGENGGGGGGGGDPQWEVIYEGSTTGSVDYPTAIEMLSVNGIILAPDYSGSNAIPAKTVTSTCSCSPTQSVSVTCNINVSNGIVTGSEKSKSISCTAPGCSTVPASASCANPVKSVMVVR